MRTDCAEFHDLKLDDAGELSEALARNGKALFLNVHRQMLQVLNCYGQVISSRRIEATVLAEFVAGMSPEAS
jgi:hypothetical protein